MKRKRAAGMKTLGAVCALALLPGSPAWAEMPVRPGAGPVDAAAAGPVDPAYRFVEGISDGVFDLMRRHVVGAILPERLRRNLKAAPLSDSAPLFDRNLRKNEGRYLARVRAAYPIGDGVRPAAEAELRTWRSWAAAEQVSVTVDSLKDTLIERYQLELFGRSSGEYAQDRRNWDPGFLTMAGILGSAFMYFNGLHAGGSVGAFNLGIDLASGLKLRRALQGGGSLNRLAGFEVGYKNAPITLSSEWGLRGGRVRSERFGLNYRLRY